MIPTRLHLDAHQLMREAVANAVRHAEAKSITIELAAKADELRLDFVNDGAAFAERGRRKCRRRSRSGSNRPAGARLVARHGRDQILDFAPDRGEAP